MTSKSKAKGSSWERDVCQTLSELYDDNFMRVPNSGAYTGGMNAHRKDVLTTEQIKPAIAKSANFSDTKLFLLILSNSNLFSLLSHSQFVDESVSS